MYCFNQKFLQMKYVLDEERLHSFSPKLDIDELKTHLSSFEKICARDITGGPIAQLDIASRFRWLTATRSTILQTSKVHPGLCVSSAEETLDRLYEQLVIS